MVLVATVFLNKTSWRQARDPLWAFLAAYPTPEACCGASAGVIEELLRPLGLQSLRAVRLIELSSAFIRNPRFEDPAAELPGIGQYGSDSWKLFCSERDTHWQGAAGDGVADKALRWYVEWRRGVAAAAEVEVGKGVEGVVVEVADGEDDGGGGSQG
ncbi:DNA glycosylase [Zopfochytrium polystomum]|nr:DNA glycosylase [Zopfochytrium polystomum]